MLAGIKAGDPRDVRVNPANPYEVVPADSWPLVLPGVFLLVGLVIAAVAALVLRSAPKVPEA